MSDYEDMFDEEELEEIYDTGPAGIDPEDAFSLCMINKVRKIKTTVELQDKDGDEVPLRDVIQELLGYIKDQLGDEEENQFSSQLMPLMAQAAVSGLGRMIGLRATAFHLANETTKHAFIHMMCVGLLLLKFIQQKNLKICTIEEEVDDEEIERIERVNQANNTATIAALAGADPISVIRELREQGHLTDEDVRDFLNQPDGDEDDEGDPGDN
jgi:hypothetical protein